VALKVPVERRKLERLVGRKEKSRRGQLRSEQCFESVAAVEDQAHSGGELG
jgi:hypothetical protein